MSNLFGLLSRKSSWKGEQDQTVPIKLQVFAKVRAAALSPAFSLQRRGLKIPCTQSSQFNIYCPNQQIHNSYLCELPGGSKKPSNGKLCFVQWGFLLIYPIQSSSNQYISIHYQTQYYKYIIQNTKYRSSQCQIENLWVLCRAGPDSSFAKRGLHLLSSFVR